MIRTETSRGDDRRRRPAERALSPVVGGLVLLALTVCLAAVVAIGVTSMPVDPGGPTAAFDLTADGEAGRLTIRHLGGDPIDVRDLSVAVAVDGTELSSNPPVPFVGAPGFDGAPRGPFNAATDPEWSTGERAGVTVADTNSPALDAGDDVVVTLSVDGRQVASLEATAR